MPRSQLVGFLTNDNETHLPPCWCVCPPLHKVSAPNSFYFFQGSCPQKGGQQKKSHIIHCLYCSQASTQTFELVKDSCRGQQLHAYCFQTMVVSALGLGSPPSSSLASMEGIGCRNPQQVLDPAIPGRLLHSHTQDTLTRSTGPGSVTTEGSEAGALPICFFVAHPAQALLAALELGVPTCRTHHSGLDRGKRIVDTCLSQSTVPLPLGHLHP